MKCFYSLFLFSLLIGCSSSIYHADEKSTHSEQGAKLSSKNWLRSDIELKDSRVTWQMMDAIISARGGMKRGDRWEVKMKEDGDVMIWKFRKDGAIYPPGAAIEFWYVGTDGKWHSRFTA